MQIINYYPVNRHRVIGNFNIMLSSGLILYKMTLMKLEDGREFVSPPSEKYTTNQGVVKYIPLVGAKNMEIRNAFFGEVLGCIKKYLKENPDAQLLKNKGKGTYPEHPAEAKAEGVPF